jgi:transcriptional regulator GlxA family with amidase domain
MTTDAIPPPGPEDPHHIGILLFDGVEELVAVGPWEVLAWWTRSFPEDGYTASTFSADGNAVTCNKGLVIQPHHSRDDVPEMAVLVHPGGDTRALGADAEHLEWLRKQRTVVPLLTSVCTGSLVYAKAGLLHDRPATTYWGALGALTENDPTIEVRPDARWVDDGDVITAAGVSAGIDMALHLVVRLAGPDRARQVRRGIQYDPEPPV